MYNLTPEEEDRINAQANESGTDSDEEFDDALVWDPVTHKLRYMNDADRVLFGDESED